MDNRCYILSASQVSCQKPLCEEWMTDPIWYDQDYVRAIEPNVREFIVPSEARRMSRILKRATCSALTALKISRIDQPDAIITGTGMGCMDSSEKFLMDMSEVGERCLKPTLFMQSTHNTISSLIAILLKCHGYNNTYSQRGISFESALLDAWLQIKTGGIRTALVGSHDEVTPFMALVKAKTDHFHKFISETDVSAILSSKNGEVNPLCEVTGVELFHKPELQDVIDSTGVESGSAIMTGINGNNQNDEPYQRILDAIPDSVPVVRYRHLFGDSFSSSAMAFYAAAHMLSRQSIPTHMMLPNSPTPENEIKEFIIVNHSDGVAWSVVKLKKI